MDPSRRSSTLENLLKFLGLSNAATAPPDDEDTAGEADEPHEPSPILILDPKKDVAYAKNMAPQGIIRRESLLTRAIMDQSRPTDSTTSFSSRAVSSRTMSTASSQSLASTAELTSDCDLTSPARSASPSPPAPTVRFPHMDSKFPPMSGKVVIAPATKDDKPAVAEVGGEAAVEKSLGRKRCIMFACANNATEPVKEPVKSTSPPAPAQRPQFEPRKCRLTFVCPTRADSQSKTTAERTPSPGRQAPPKQDNRVILTPLEIQTESASKPKITSPAFHEFGTSQDETDSWVDQPMPQGPKLTLDDCNKKENAIRRIAKEAEEEAEAEEMELEELEEEMDDDEDEVADDFAPSDEESDGGNESDDEGGFADSDEETDDGSEYQFWAPAPTAASTHADNLNYFSSRRSRSNSVGSTHTQSSSSTGMTPGRRRKTKAIRMRPGTPELPDSTDFVCGTLDEDRPLEAAFIACREQRKRDKQIMIPQDIDPSFPTSDPEDDQDDDDAEDQSQRIVDQLVPEESSARQTSAFRISPGHAPVATRPEPALSRRPANRSPPPPRHRSPPPPTRLRSPAPRRLFSNSPARLRSPPPAGRYRSPRGSPTMKIPLGITINRLAQRPNTTRTASLPQTPNPFFRNWERGSPPLSRIPSAAVTPSTENDETRSDIHVRGPVDIVIGLEKKRQKRKEKLWRQHCRKAAKEQADRKPLAGRGVERMKELGLECAERTRGYGLGQQAKLVLSL